MRGRRRGECEGRGEENEREEERRIIGKRGGEIC